MNAPDNPGARILMRVAITLTSRTPGPEQIRRAVHEVLADRRSSGRRDPH